MNELVKLCQEQSCKSEATYGFRFAEAIYCRHHGLQHNAKTMYQVCKCGTSTPRFKLPEDVRASACGKCCTPNMINIADRRCECKKHLPSYGMPDDKRANYCGECKKEGMVNLKSKNQKCLCKRVRPGYGFPTDIRPTGCIQCKKDGMINLLTPLCPCGKTAVFGFKTDTKPTYCMKCAKPQMENIVTKKCKCGKTVPVFGKPTDKKATCCISCKTETMINITCRKCKCGKSQPVFGLLTDTQPSYCKECKTSEMVDIRSKKCKCGKAQPNFGLKGDKKATTCVDCKSSEMINLKAKMCKCGKSQPYFGLPTDKKPTCCATCKSPEMKDILSENSPTRLCKGTLELQQQGLKCPYDQRGKKKYDYYCTACFEQNFPQDPRTANIRGRTEEVIVRDFLAKSYPENTFIHNKPLWTGEADCTCRRRIDFRALYGNTLLCIEVDEDQHKYRDQADEDLRYDDLMMLHGGKFIFIRFNPHLYKDKEGKRKNPSMDTRLSMLKTTIDTEIQRIQSDQNTELLEVVKLYFDEN